jgi:uncharacterized protein
VLYLDSSVVVKLYFDEVGSKSIRDRVKQRARIFTSNLSFAEVHATFARKYRENSISSREFEILRRSFASDWILNKFVQIEVDSISMADVPDLVKKHSLKGADAVHLAAALWLQEKTKLSHFFASSDTLLEFCVADQHLASIASRCGLAVFNPETAS